MKEAILKALSYVEDPDLKKDLVTLNMIKELEINDNQVSFELELTTPACPMKDMLVNACKTAIRTMVSADLLVNINVTSRVTTNRSNAEVLKGIKNIIAIASGKGGVGKSTVAIELAKSLKKSGASVGILDADIHGPSIPVLLGLGESQPEMQGDKLVPIEKDGLRLMSIGFLVPRKQAIVWRGPMLASALKQFSSDVLWGDLDYLIIDLPPGTGDVHLSLIQLIPLNGIIIVTTPDEVSTVDAGKALDMYTNPQLKQEILGVVENMSYFKPEGSTNAYYLFGKDGGKALAEEWSVDLLGQIPLVEKDKPQAKLEAFDVFAGRVAQKLAILNALN